MRRGHETEGLEEMHRTARSDQKEGRQNGGGMWPFFGSDQRGSEGD